MAPYLSRSVLSVLLIHLCLAAPGQPKTNRAEDSNAAVSYPFESKEESHRLLRSYIDFLLNKEDQERPEINSWEQEVFFVFRLHDYDRSGLLDGLEMIKLLYDFNDFKTPGVVHSHNEVVTVVDYLLQSQDLNHDGLFSPSELLSPSLTQHEETVKDVIDGAQNEVEVQMDTQPQQEERTEEDRPVAAADEQQNNPITEQVENMAPVHQGQPEM